MYINSYKNICLLRTQPFFLFDCWKKVIYPLFLVPTGKAHGCLRILILLKEPRGMSNFYWLKLRYERPLVKWGMAEYRKAFQWPSLAFDNSGPAPKSSSRALLNTPRNAGVQCRAIKRNLQISRSIVLPTPFRKTSKAQRLCDTIWSLAAFYLLCRSELHHSSGLFLLKFSFPTQCSYKFSQRW